MISFSTIFLPPWCVEVHHLDFCIRNQHILKHSGFTAIPIWLARGNHCKILLASEVVPFSMLAHFSMSFFHAQTRKCVTSEYPLANSFVCLQKPHNLASASSHFFSLLMSLLDKTTPLILETVTRFSLRDSEWVVIVLFPVLPQKWHLKPNKMAETMCFHGHFKIEKAGLWMNLSLAPLWELTFSKDFWSGKKKKEKNESIETISSHLQNCVNKLPFVSNICKW